MREPITVSKSVTILKCDICGETAGRGGFGCVICRRDLCTRHAIFDPRDSSDYPSKYCESCWSVGEPFRAEEKIEQERHDTEMDRITDAWYVAAGQK